MHSVVYLVPRSPQIPISTALCVDSPGESIVGGQYGAIMVPGTPHKGGTRQCGAPAEQRPQKRWWGSLKTVSYSSTARTTSVQALIVDQRKNIRTVRTSQKSPP